ncbi:MAG TPA: hypothetical protein VK675_00985, partial [Candidatus Paceibacterota bacterium]|nr:hypothetical protein [Candidatus Paceibacterota bacterium]
VEKRSENQIKQDESTFFQPLADLGIEFQQKDRAGGERMERYPERDERRFPKPVSRVGGHSNLGGKPGIFGAIKKVFTAAKPPGESGGGLAAKPRFVQKASKDNLALREILNKVIAKPSPQPKVSVPSSPVPPPVSLDVLKNPPAQAGKNISMHPKDRAASAEDMSKLKDLISAKSSNAGTPLSESTPGKPDASKEVSKEKISTPSPAATASSQPTPAPPPIPSKQKSIKEVPEDILRKILE